MVVDLFRDRRAALGGQGISLRAVPGECRGHQRALRQLGNRTSLEEPAAQGRIENGRAALCRQDVLPLTPVDLGYSIFCEVFARADMSAAISALGV
jgi:hypothetical protein